MVQPMRANPPLGRHAVGRTIAFCRLPGRILGQTTNFDGLPHRVLRNEASRSLAVAARLRFGRYGGRSFTVAVLFLRNEAKR